MITLNRKSSQIRELTDNNGIFTKLLYLHVRISMQVKI